MCAARAAEVNVDTAALEAARDGDDPKTEITALIMAQIESAVGTTPAQLLTELKAMNLKQLRGELLAVHIATSSWLLVSCMSSNIHLY
jgi:hypothetical protein